MSRDPGRLPGSLPSDLPPPPPPLPATVIDAHTHLDACGATGPAGVRAALDRAAAVGVCAVVTVADDMTSARWVVQASNWDDRVFAAVALHPTRTATMTDADRAELERLARAPRVVAVGETGLDYYWTHADPDCPSPEVQREAYRWHIDLAKRVGKPLMIHDRDAHGDVLAVLEQEGPPQAVVFHCFSGDAAMARACVDAGYVLSFSGTVTFRNARALREAAVLVPDGQLLVETDAPFLTPHPYRGKLNEPVNLPYTVRDLAALRGQDVAELAASSSAAAERVFGFTVLRRHDR
ncbi:MAG TPA: TatD family hydrolase [Pseudonocardiaceae bacterium]|nr:TatD family hydrolase [Pseudonocardiaceae bacterium]